MTMDDKTSNAVATDLRVIEFQQFDTSFAVPPSEEEQARRRYMTLIAAPTHTENRLSQSEVLRVGNTEGEYFALKRLRPLPTDVDPTSRRGREAALFEEYRNQLAVSHLQGFAQVFGYGVTREGEPAILMEWVDGLTLHDALERHSLPLAADSRGVDGVVVAALALSVLQTLVSTTYLDGTFAHRDISPRNIMLRCAGEPPSNGSLGREVPIDACLIDLGSAIYMRRDEATFTMTMDVWRNATPEYAPPEMLALSDRSYLEARRSPAIDIYALCSVLYEVYSGHTPYEVAAHPDQSPLELKTAAAPHPLAAHDERDQPLIQAIMEGLAMEQAKRPSAAALLRRVGDWYQDVTGLAPSQAVVPSFAPARGTHLTKAASTSTLTESQTTPDAVEKVQQAQATAPQPRRRNVSRRGLVIGTACVAAAAIFGGLNLTPQGRALLFGQKSWQELADLAARLSAAGSRDDALSLAVQAGIASEDGSMVDNLVKSLTLSDGTEARVQLVDFCHDDRVDGGGKAGLTFAFLDPLAPRAMADTPMVSGGWEQCDMRAWLNGDFMAQLPAEVSDAIVPVTKLTNNTGATRTPEAVTTTEDSVFLFSIFELGGMRVGFTADFTYLGDILNIEGTQYRLWADKLVSSNRENPTMQRTWQGQPCYWWNRTPSPDCSEDNGQTWFNRVGPDGDVFHYACDATGDENVTTILPGFCL